MRPRPRAPRQLDRSLDAGERNADPPVWAAMMSKTALSFCQSRKFSVEMPLRSHMRRGFSSTRTMRSASGVGQRLEQDARRRTLKIAVLAPIPSAERQQVRRLQIRGFDEAPPAVSQDLGEASPATTFVRAP